ncbi:MAG: DUF2341 domain-containing protein [bacterium]
MNTRIHTLSLGLLFLGALFFPYAHADAFATINTGAGSTPNYSSVAEKKLYAGSGSDDVVVINGADDSVSHIPVGGPTGFSVPVGNKVYMETNDGIVVINATTDTVITTIPVLGLNGRGGTYGTVVGTHLYWGNISNSTVSVIDTTTDTVVGSPISVGGVPFSASVVGTTIYLNCQTANTVYVIDADPRSTNYNTVIATIPVGGSPYYSTAFGKKVYVSNNSDATMSVIDADPESASYNHVIGSPIPIGSAPYTARSIGHKIYVSVYGDNAESVIDTTDTTPEFPGGRFMKKIPVGVAPDYARFVGTRLYVANQGDHSVSVIDTDTDTVVGTISGTGIRYPSVIGTKVYVPALGYDSVTVIDTTTDVTGDFPQLVSFSTSSPDGTYSASDTIPITANFGRPLHSGSTMTVRLNTGASVVLNSVSGTQLSGTYTVGVNDQTPDLAVSSILSASVTDTTNHTRMNYAMPYSAGNFSAENSLIERNIGDSKNIVIGTFFSIPVGNNPYQISPVVTVGGTKYVYVANQGDGTVSVIRLSDSTVVSTITVGSEPYGIASATVSGVVYLYVANTGSKSVSVIDTSTNTVAATVTVGLNPYYATTVGTNVYVTNGLSNTVSVIDANTNTLESTVEVGSYPRGIKAHGTNVYVANYGDINNNYGGNNTISVIDANPASPTFNQVTATIVSPGGSAGPRGVTMHTDATLGDKVYVSNFRSDTVSVIDVNPAHGNTYNKIVQTIAVGKGPRGMTIFGDYVYVENFDDGTISIIDTTASGGLGALIGSIDPAGHSPSGITPVTGAGVAIPGIYFSRFQDGVVSIIDTATNQVYPPHPATTYTITGPSTGVLNTVSDVFSVRMNGTFSGAVTITPSGGGITNPIVLHFSNSPTQFFTITPSAVGTISLTASNDGGLPDPSSLTYLAYNTMPFVSTGSATVLSDTSVQMSGTVTDIGTSTVTTTGFHYGTDASLVTYSDSRTIDLSITSTPTGFQRKNSGLICNTRYYYQAYATNTSGTSYGTIQSFTTDTCGSASPTVAWYDTAWSYRTKLTIDRTKVANSDQTNFPVLIRSTNSAWKSAAHNGHVAFDTGNDIVFVADDGVTKLNHEIEKYDPTTGELIAWVRVPTVSYTADTDVYMYYGNASASDQSNPTGVWTNHFGAVYHLSDSGPSIASDTTGNHDATTSGAITFGQTGTIHKAVTFDGTIGGDMDTGYVVPSSDISISAWAQSSSTGITNRLLGANGTNIIWGARNVSTSLIASINSASGGGGSINIDVPSLASGWHYIELTIDSTNGTQLYDDGVLVGSSISKNIVSTNSFHIGNDGDGVPTDVFDGSVDEVHFATVARSADWVMTEYANQQSTASFYSQSREENQAFSINGGATTTASPAVTLSLTCAGTPGPCTMMQFSDDGVTYSSFESFSTTKLYTLSAGDGTKTVYVKFKDGSSNLSTPISSSILLDSTPPTGSISINSGAQSTRVTSVTLTLSCSDVATSCAQMQFSNDDTTYTSLESFSTTKSYTLSSGLGIKTVYVRFTDALGNVSPSFSASIDYETAAPAVATTSPLVFVTKTSAVLLGSVTDIGTSAVVTTGFHFGTDPALATSIDVHTDGQSINASPSSFSETLSGLTCATTYYYRSYATNSDGTGNGSIQNFATSPCTSTGVVATCGDLADMSTDLSGSYSLSRDLDCSGISFTSIGTAVNPFLGTFDGRGHTITGLSITGVSNVGLFGFVQDATISNLGLVSVSITGKNQVGALVGSATGTTRITHSYATGSITGSANGVSVGGLVGYTNGTVSISKSYSTATITTGSGYSSAGGLVGQADGALTINDSYARGNITSSSAGGLVGNTTGTVTVTNAYATGNINNRTRGTFAGGLVASSTGAITITNAFSAGSLTGSGTFGGIIGRYNGSTGITNAYFTDASANNAKGVLVGSVGLLKSIDHAVYAQGGGSPWNFTTTWAFDGGINNGFPFLLPVAVPSVTAGSVSAITTSTATLAGSITNIGGVAVATRGFHYGFTASYGSLTTESGSFDTGDFSAQLTGLLCATQYHLEAYATNSIGTGTSSPDVTFTTSQCPVTSRGHVDQTSGTTTTQANTTKPQIGTQTSGSGAFVFKKVLRVGSKGPDVLALQKYLNSQGFIIAQKGTGSIGKESTYFGKATAKALAKFQEAHAKEILTPSGLKKGTGVLGTSTIAYINKTAVLSR